MRRLIITADDFGLALPVNEAVEEAHLRGVLTCASLMMNGTATRDAIERARRLPKLRIGLHIVIVEGRPVLPPDAVHSLVDGNGEFLRNLTLAGVRFFFHPLARRHLAAEVRAQFEAFHRAGLMLDHVNAHNHMHLHPTVLGIILGIGGEYGMKTMRVPREPGGATLVSFWAARLRSRLRRNGILSNDFVLGLQDSGSMVTERAMQLLGNLPDGVTEMYFHPATRKCPDLERDMPGYLHEEEFQTLMSKEFRDAVISTGAKLISYGDLSGG